MTYTCPRCKAPVLVIWGGTVTQDSSGIHAACPFCGFGEKERGGRAASPPAPLGGGPWAPED
jgi:DNA-directed RNA polymerase subunit RPC12/RpoP